MQKPQNQIKKQVLQIIPGVSSRHDLLRCHQDSLSSNPPHLLNKNRVVYLSFMYLLKHPLYVNTSYR